jgi:hypothetical protein
VERAQIGLLLVVLGLAAAVVAGCVGRPEPKVSMTTAFTDDQSDAVCAKLLPASGVSHATGRTYVLSGGTTSFGPPPVLGCTYRHDGGPDIIVHFAAVAIPADANFDFASGFSYASGSVSAISGHTAAETSAIGSLTQSQIDAMGTLLFEATGRVRWDPTDIPKPKARATAQQCEQSPVPAGCP